MNPRRQRREKFGHRDFHFVGSKMDVGSLRKRLNQLGENGFQHVQALSRLHVVAHRPTKSCAVAWNVDFGDDNNAVLSCESL